MAGNFYFKAHRHPEEVILAVCDEEILGQTFYEGDLRITVGEGFYGGDIIEEEELRTRLGTFTIINLVGNRVVDLAIAEGIVDPDAVMVVGGVKHAQAVTL